MTNLILFPILIPFFTAVFCVIGYKNQRFQQILSLVGSAGLLTAVIALFVHVYKNGPVSLQMGGWPAPFGITWIVDLLSAIMLVLAGLMTAAVAVYAYVDIDERRQSLAYHPLYHFLMMGVCGSFITGDIFNLYVWFEIMLISSFVLLELGGHRNQLEGAIKYMTLNVIASAIFLAAVGILYGLTGSLNMAHLGQEALANAPPATILALSMMFLVGFGIKAALFPLFGWLPAAYHTPPTAISAIFSGLLTKVGVYALFRIFTALFVQNTGYTHTILLYASGLTMFVGVLGAASQVEFRRILSFHIVSQIGYMIMGLALFTPLALAGAVFYIIHHIIVKTNLFLVSGLVNRLKGSYRLDRIGGLYAKRPFLGILFLIPALSLAGIPPLSGFWAKFALVKAGLEAEEYFIVVVSLVVSVLTLYSMTKIWSQAFWSAEPEGGEDLDVPAQDWWGRVLPIAALCVFTLIIGFSAEWVFQLSMKTADQLLNPDLYYFTTVLEK